MLQIITGRFFRSEEVYRTSQRAVLYSNYRGRNRIDTAVGSLVPASGSSDLASHVYEVEQVLEAVSSDGSPSVLVSMSVDHLAADFAALVSFCLRVTCSYDSGLVSRLSQSHLPPLGAQVHPNTLVHQVFDRSIRLDQVDEDSLPRFVKHLVRLERKRYLAAIRAIRRYTIGLHRIGDDPALAYTLLVASVESLAQRFDQFSVAWSDLDQAKRNPIDRALAEAKPSVRKEVRRAVLEIEHVALTRRYREFVLRHLPPSFFREDAADIGGPAAAGPLETAITRAYRYRSRMVHELEELPRPLLFGRADQDIVDVDFKPTLTLNGLARITRQVILRFVELSPGSDSEEYNYRPELPNVVVSPVAPQYWIWRAAGYNSNTANRYLGGFLQQLERVVVGEESSLTDLTEVLQEVEQRASGVTEAHARPMIALYLIYQRSTKQPLSEEASDFLAAKLEILQSQSIESLVCHTVLQERVSWSLEEHEAARTKYLGQRYHRRGLRVGSMFEAAMSVDLAERMREAGNTTRALELIAEAVETLPGHSRLLEVERSWAAGDRTELSWPDMLIPVNSPSVSSDAL